MFLSEEAQEAVYSIAHTYFRQGQYEMATPLFRTLTCANPRAFKFRMALAATYQASKNYDKALDSYETALMLNPGDFRIHFYAAHCFFALQNYDKGLLALNWAEKAIREQPVDKRQNLKAQIQLLRQAWKKERDHA